MLMQRLNAGAGVSSKETVNLGASRNVLTTFHR